MIDDIAKSHGLTQEISEAFCNSARSEIDKDGVRYYYFKKMSHPHVLFVLHTNNMGKFCSKVFIV